MLDFLHIKKAKERVYAAEVEAVFGGGFETSEEEAEDAH
jgi:hypothetical protein